MGLFGATKKSNKKNGSKRKKRKINTNKLLKAASIGLSFYKIYKKSR
jgi:hypothetical protein